MKSTTRANQKTWDKVAPSFFEASALPVWGPFSAGRNLNLLGSIKGKTFLEIGCGSGRSIGYLIKNGAKKVYGLDFSASQIAEARRYNKKAVKNGQVELFHSPMEEKINIKRVDIVYSVYAFGWTQEPEKTLSTIYSYLKPGGKFIWSWDHSFFTDVEYKNNGYAITRSYHDEKPIHRKTWMGSGAHFVYRKTSSWFKLINNAGFTITEYYEPEPRNLARGSNDPTKYYSIQKAKLIPCTMIFVCRK